MQFGRKLRTFQRTLLPPSSEKKIKQRGYMGTNMGKSGKNGCCEWATVAP
jgi:hypothetical protein